MENNFAKKMVTHALGTLRCYFVLGFLFFWKELCSDVGSCTGGRAFRLFPDDILTLDDVSRARYMAIGVEGNGCLVAC